MTTLLGVLLVGENALKSLFKLQIDLQWLSPSVTQTQKEKEVTHLGHPIHLTYCEL